MNDFLVHADSPSQYKLQVYTLKPFLSVGLFVRTCGFLAFFFFFFFLSVLYLPKSRLPPVVDLVNQLNVFLNV